MTKAFLILASYLSLSACGFKTPDKSSGKYTNGLKRGHEILTNFAIDDANLYAKSRFGTEAFFPREPLMMAGGSSTNPLIRGNYLTDFPLEKTTNEVDLFALAEENSRFAFPVLEREDPTKADMDIYCKEFSFTPREPKKCKESLSKKDWQYLPFAQNFHFLRQTATFELDSESKELITWAQSSHDAAEVAINLVQIAFVKALVARSQGKEELALNYLGVATHILQDSFSEAHAVRENGLLSEICTFGFSAEAEGICEHTLADIVVHDIVWSNLECTVLTADPNYCSRKDLKSDAEAATIATTQLLSAFVEASQLNITSSEQYYSLTYPEGCYVASSLAAYCLEAEQRPHRRLMELVTQTISPYPNLNRKSYWSKKDELLSLIDDPTQNHAFILSGATGGWDLFFDSFDAYHKAKTENLSIAFGGSLSPKPLDIDILKKVAKNLPKLSGLHLNSAEDLKSFESTDLDEQFVNLHFHDREIRSYSMDFAKKAKKLVLNTPLSPISLEGFPDLEELSVSTTQLKLKNLPKLRKLKSLPCISEISSICVMESAEFVDLPMLELLQPPIESVWADSGETISYPNRFTLPYAKSIKIKNLDSIYGISDEWNAVSENLIIEDMKNLDWIAVGAQDKLKSLTLRQLPTLGTLSVYSKSLSKIDFDEFPRLEWLNVTNSGITSLAPFTKIDSYFFENITAGENQIGRNEIDCPSGSEVPKAVSDFCEDYL